MLQLVHLLYNLAIAMMSRLPQLYEQRQLNAHLFQQSNKSEVMEFEQYFALRYTCNLTESVMLLTFILIIISIPSPPHSFIPGLKPSFFVNPSHRCLPFLLPDWLHGFPGLFTDTSVHIRFLLFSFFLFSTFSLLVPCGIFYYRAAFNAPLVGHKDNESPARSD